MGAQQPGAPWGRGLPLAEGRDAWRCPNRAWRGPHAPSAEWATSTIGLWLPRRCHLLITIVQSLLALALLPLRGHVTCPHRRYHYPSSVLAGWSCPRLGATCSERAQPVRQTSCALRIREDVLASTPTQACQVVEAHAKQKAQHRPFSCGERGPGNATSQNSARG